MSLNVIPVQLRYDGMAVLLDVIVGPAWREWSEEAVGAVSWVLTNCLEHVGWDNPESYPVPFLRAITPPPPPTPHSVFRLRPAADIAASQEGADKP